MSDERRAKDASELAVGLENVKRCFRQTMAARARLPGESLEALRRRLAADPATARVAQLTACTVDQLLEGLGAEQRFLVDPSYDHAAATAVVSALVERVATTPIGTNDAAWGDALERAPRPAQAALQIPLSAPALGAERGQVLADRETTERLRLERTRPPVRARAQQLGEAFKRRWR